MLSSVALAVVVLVAAAAVLAEPNPCTLNDPVDPRVMHQEIRQKVRNIFVGTKDNAGLFMKGGQEVDALYTSCFFRQDPYFLYLTGANEEELNLFVDLASGYTILFVPYRDEDWMVWNGVGRTREEICAQYGMNECQYNDDIEATLARQNVSLLYTFPGVVFPGMQDYAIETTTLEPVLRAGRTIKTQMELQTMRMGTQITCEAHAAWMTTIEPGWWEYQAESAFLKSGYDCGCRFQSYSPIFGTGSNGAVLHYNANTDQTADGQVILVDAAPEYRGYASDVTRTVPVNGRWTAEQLAIYNIVLQAQTTSINMVAPGAIWGQISQNAQRVILQGLLDIGLLVNGSVDELLAAGIDRLFYMHSLGHMIGLQVHDVEGYLYDAATHTIRTPKNPTLDPYVRHLRGDVMDINVLEVGMVFTIEPGLYFNPVLLDPAFENPVQSRYLNEPAIRAYYDFGGVRIEDVIEVTNTGYSIMSLWLAKSPADVEELMASSAPSDISSPLRQAPAAISAL